MKRMKFLTCAAALFAAGVAFTSCTNSDAPAKNVEVSGITVESARVISAEANVDATFKVGIQSKTVKAGETATFEVTGNKATLTATAAGTGYLEPTQTATLSFDDEVNTATIAFTFVKKSTNEVAQAVAIGGDPVTNDAENAVTVVPASITVPEGVNITGTTGDFSITASLPATSVKGTDQESDNVSAVKLTCEPAGAEFSKPVTLTAYIGKDAAGMAVTILDPNNDKLVEKIVDNDGYVSFDVNHFSIYTITFSININPTGSGIESLYNQNINVIAGDNNVPYLRNFGFSTSGVNPLFGIAMGSFFGGFYAQQPSLLTFTASAAGTANVNIIQEYTDYTISCGFVSTSVRSWGAVTAVVTPQGGQSHSGGSGR